MSLLPILNVSVQPSKLQFAVTKAREFVKGHKILSCDISVFYIHVVILPYSSRDKIIPKKLHSSIKGHKMLSYDISNFQNHGFYARNAIRSPRLNNRPNVMKCCHMTSVHFIYKSLLSRTSS